MALISELNVATAEAIDYPLPTVAMFSRVLREAGLISKKGRGRGAAHATPVDGARLLTALLATPSPFAGGRMPQAAECVADFGDLVIEGYDGEYAGSGFLISAYGLPRCHTFEQAFAAVIAGFAEERFAAFFKAAKLQRLEVELLDFALGATIRLAGNTYHYGFAMHPPLEKASADLVRVSSKYKRGIESRRMIGFDVLRKIAAVINGREVNRTTNGDLK